jgi:HlyD family secretion protein
MNTTARIPIPLQQRLRDMRMRLIPAIVFTAALIAIGFMWKDYVAAPTMVGQAESIQASVSCYKPGMLAELSVNRFQMVKAGDSIGKILVADPKILASSLAVVEAEIEALRVGMEPVTAQQRAAINYDQLRLDWMKQRAQLATAQVNLQWAGTELRRTDELFKEKILSQAMLEEAQAKQNRLQQEVDELAKLVTEQEQNFKQLQITNSIEASEKTLRAAIAVQESKLHLIEAELSPITLSAPVDGMISVIYHRSGEAITAGEPVVAIAALNSPRIVGYLRPPITCDPKVGMNVEVRTRGLHRQVGSAKIVEVGVQLEPIAPALLPPVKLANGEFGLPVAISLPTSLKVLPGELLDLTLLPDIHPTEN